MPQSPSCIDMPAVPLTFLPFRRLIFGAISTLLKSLRDSHWHFLSIFQTWNLFVISLFIFCGFLIPHELQRDGTICVRAYISSAFFPLVRYRSCVTTAQTSGSS